jgi:hypothetical protein
VSDFNDIHAGDKVLINGQPATIIVIDETANSLVFETELDGGGTNTTYAHVSNSRIEALPTAEPAVEAPVEEPVVESKPAVKK